MGIHIVALIVHCIRIELEFGKGWFLRRGENRSTRRKTSRSREKNIQTQPTYDTEGEGRGENRSTRRKTSRSREENQQQTQPTYDAETWNRTHIGGRQVLSPLRQPCSLCSSRTPLCVVNACKSGTPHKSIQVNLIFRVLEHVHPTK